MNMANKVCYFMAVLLIDGCSHYPAMEWLIMPRLHEINIKWTCYWRMLDPSLWNTFSTVTSLLYTIHFKCVHLLEIIIIITIMCTYTHYKRHNKSVFFHPLLSFVYPHHEPLPKHFCQSQTKEHFTSLVHPKGSYDYNFNE